MNESHVWVVESGYAHSGTEEYIVFSDIHMAAITARRIAGQGARSSDALPDDGVFERTIHLYWNGNHFVKLVQKTVVHSVRQWEDMKNGKK